MRRRSWKDYVCRKMYCRPDLNRKIMCLKRSFVEVCEILNNGSRCGK
ncbi:hypothetical protein [Faecalicatena contorta]|nr:hypothetical protein [Faecalicatena contorta]